jgi:hypothetical protein
MGSTCAVMLAAAVTSAAPRPLTHPDPMTETHSIEARRTPTDLPEECAADTEPAPTLPDVLKAPSNSATLSTNCKRCFVPRDSELTRCRKRMGWGFPA